MDQESKLMEIPIRYPWKKTISNMLNILPKDHPYIQDLRISLSRILDRAISGDIATVTKITDPNSSNMYLNLEFGDGFVCGVEGNLVNEI